MVAVKKKEKKEFDPLNFEVVTYGPTWQKDENGDWLLPEFTLGWEIAGWCAEWLTNEDGAPWVFTLEQLRFVLWLYAIDENGKFLYRNATFQRIKGHGKDPLAAILCLVELIGPCRFSHFDASGNAIAKDNPSAWVQMASVSFEQNKNTMMLIPLYLPDRTRLAHGIGTKDVGKEKVYAYQGRRRLEAITSAPRSSEGNRPSFFLANEALALDTPIPSPKGWTTMGELSTGDVIYGADGAPVSVIEALPVQEGRRCFEVAFNDGSTITASDGHLWTIYHPSNPKKLKTVTTLDMFEDGRKFFTPWPGARQSEPVELPLDPYLLGAWLGDGSAGQPNITCGNDDVEQMESILASRGIPTHRLNKTSADKAWRISFATRLKGRYADAETNPAKTLSRMACYREKHIPEDYFAGSIEQRLDLLRGLMDTDGHANKRGGCVFVGRERLCRDLMRLLQSLGERPSLAFRPDERSRDGGYWSVTFVSHGLQPFLFARKAARTRISVETRVRITSITEVPSVPVRCIAVDADDRLFQAGPTGQVTHNTHHWTDSNGGNDMYDVVERNAVKAKDAGTRILQITNAYMPGEDSVAERTRDAYMKTITINPETGRLGSTAKGILYDSLEAPSYAPLTVEAAPYVLAKVRGDSVWLDIDSIVQSILDPRNKPSRSRRFWYNQVTADEEALIGPGEWDEIQANVSLKEGDEIVLGLDGGKTDDATALVAIRLADRAIIPLGIWQRKPNMEDWEVPRLEVDGAVANTFARYKVRAFFSDVSQWESYVDLWSDRYRDQLLIKAVAGRSTVGFDMRGHQEEITKANEALVGAILEGAICHNGDLDLRAHVLNTRGVVNQYGMTFGKVGGSESTRKNDAYAATLLAYIAMNRYLESGKRPKEHSGKFWMF